MNIVVCFKVIPELEKTVPADWQAFDAAPDIAYLGSALNCFEEAALEMALRLKETGQNVRCTAVTLGVLPGFLAKKIFAAGYDEIVVLGNKAFDFSPRQTARLLGSYMAGISPGLVLSGKQTALMDSGMVPFYLAQTLNLPVVGDVTGCKWEGGSRLHITHEAQNGLCSTIVRPPMVLSVGNSSVGALRMASLPAVLAAGKRSVTALECAWTEKPLPYRLHPRPLHRCTFIEGDTKAQVAFINKTLGQEDVP